MNRPAVGPQSLRGLPNGFPGPQQVPQNRSVSNRLPPSGKIASNGSTWAFGAVPMGSAGLGNPRVNSGSLASFAQTIGGSSQPATPLDLSEFPSLLSNTSNQPSQSTWASSGSRAIGQSGMRLQQGGPSQQLGAQDDLFGSSAQSNQAFLRFGNQNTAGQSAQSNSVDEFPPLNRNLNGEIGQDRNALQQSTGFGAQSNGLGFGSTSRSNGLLNVLSGSTRASAGNRVSSPGSMSGGINRSPVDTRQNSASENEPVAFSNEQFGSAMPPYLPGTAPQPAIPRMDGLAQPRRPSQPQTQTQPQQQPQPQEVAGPLRAQPADPGSSSQDNGEEHPEYEDPLAHMSEIDKWGLKGFSYMMRNYPDYAALVTGIDLSTLGFDLNSTEPFCDQIYSLFDNEPPRPAVPPFTLPECYTVSNVAPLESKLPNFNDEALIFMFYSNPGDMQQILAAQELNNRNWRYHKKLRLWLTKDELMVPQPLGNGTERGYYIFFDIKQWQRERREFTLVYDDLETLPPTPQRPL